MKSWVPRAPKAELSLRDHRAPRVSQRRDDVAFRRGDPGCRPGDPSGIRCRPLSKLVCSPARITIRATCSDLNKFNANKPDRLNIAQEIRATRGLAFGSVTNPECVLVSTYELEIYPPIARLLQTRKATVSITRSSYPSAHPFSAAATLMERAYPPRMPQSSQRR
jgi:hypothetical protein